jgi:hypothetical protein
MYIFTSEMIYAIRQQIVDFFNRFLDKELHDKLDEQ